MTEQTNFQHMQLATLHEAMAEQKYVVVDIRDATSFQTNHIPGAIHLSNENFSDFIREADLDAPVVVCCYHGISSQQAAQFLISQDFTEVYSLDGGFTDWQIRFPTQFIVLTKFRHSKITYSLRHQSENVFANR